ncbi:MAG: hypothetical protein ACON5A_03190 [Candidatus Comchoanobacterales bacterium]
MISIQEETMSDDFHMPSSETLSRLPWDYLRIEATGFKKGEKGPLYKMDQRQVIITPYCEWLITYEPHPKKPIMTMSMNDNHFGLKVGQDNYMTPESQLFHNVIYLAQICVQEHWRGARIIDGSERSKPLFASFLVVNELQCPDYKKDKAFKDFKDRNQDILEDAYKAVEKKKWPAPEFNKL